MARVDRRIGLLFAVFLLLLAAAGAKAGWLGVVKASSLKHAAATHARVQLSYDDGTVRLEVCDDGRGTTGAGDTGFGLLGLRERASRLGGSVEVESAPGHGTTVRVAVPG